MEDEEHKMENTNNNKEVRCWSALLLQPQWNISIVWACCNSLGDKMAENEWMNLSVILTFIKKEPKEEEMTEEEKAAQKARPVATNPIPGTPWYAHHQDATQLRCTLLEHIYAVLFFSSCLHVCVCLSVHSHQVCGMDGRRSRVLLQPDDTAVHVGPARGAGWPSWCWQTHPGAPTQERTGGRQEARCGQTRVVSQV